MRKILWVFIFIAFQVYAMDESVVGTYKYASKSKVAGLKIYLKNEQLFASLDVGSGSCTGLVEGKIKKQADNSYLMERDEYGNSCLIKFKTMRNGFEVVEEDCFYGHGMSCTFSALLTRKK
jgi:hypothetical protein